VTTDPKSPPNIWPARVFSIVLMLVGLGLLLSGAWLALKGGSLYYLIAGIGIVISAILTWRTRRLGAGAYGLVVLISVVWAVWEVGLEFWGLLPRLNIILGLGLGFCLPPVFRALGPTNVTPKGRVGTFAAAFAGAVIIGLGAHAVTPKGPIDPLYRTGMADGAPGVDLTATSAPAVTPGDWLHYGNDQGGSRFSPLNQLTPENVGKLKVAWEFHVGDIGPMGKGSHLEATPLKVGNSVYVCTSYNDIISLDAETGKQNWRFDPGVKPDGIPSSVCRGVAYYEVPNAVGPCAHRVITNTVDARLLAVDADTGQRCSGFGTNGEVSLLDGMGRVDKGFYYTTSAPTIARGKVVLGGFVLDGQFWGEPSGVIRAFDAVTGKLSWAYDMGHPDVHTAPAPGDQYTASTPNAWAPMSADDALGMVYVPTGNVVPDYFGGQRRLFDEKYSSSVLAIDSDTGALRWSFQTTHHDLWDYDVASQPTLADIPTKDGIKPVLIQPTKRGEVFVLDRRTGQPVATVMELGVPQAGAVPEERLSKTQPFSIGMPAFNGPKLQEKDMWGVTPFDQIWCRVKFREARYEGTMTPPGLTPSIADPGYLGGSDWGSISVDRDRHIMIVNSNHMPNYDQLLTRAAADRLGLKSISKGYKGDAGGAVAQENTPYAANISPFLSPLGAPCNAPPYGRLTAVDLSNGKVVWTRTIGTARDSGPLGIPSHLPIPMGTPNAGGSVTTRGGLVFIAATQESAIRAVDVTTGKTVWETRLPAGGQATPAIYWSDKSQRQFVVIAASGNGALRTRVGDSIIAYALPKPEK
jgi:quinoprotein glucose dehydrogenase